jgi:hypothetical protein
MPVVSSDVPQFKENKHRTETTWMRSSLQELLFG